MRDIKDWFRREKHVVNIPEDWIPLCIDFIREQNANRDPPIHVLKNQIWQHYLHADIRQFGTGCLPEGVFGADSMALSGFYVVQMLEIRDISKSAYTQLQKLEGRDNPNAEVAATQAQPEPTEGKRVLKMKLTDGLQTGAAMEYQPIPALTTNLKPGVKLLLQGSIQVRCGMLLLTRENVVPLGGSVEPLAEENSHINVLRREVGRDVEVAVQEGQQNQMEEDQQSVELFDGEDQENVPPLARAQEQNNSFVDGLSQEELQAFDDDFDAADFEDFEDFS